VGSLMRLGVFCWLSAVVCSKFTKVLFDVADAECCSWGSALTTVIARAVQNLSTAARHNNRVAYNLMTSAEVACMVDNFATNGLATGKRIDVCCVAVHDDN
jgi:hypothetical protein